MDYQKICGFVTLYNPINEHLVNIAAMAYHLERLYVVDNSFDGECSWINTFCGIPNIIVLSSGINLGIGAALNLAIKKARSESYEWMLTMDQDSVFDKDQIERFFHSLSCLSCEQIAILSPLHGKLNYSPSDQIIYELVKDVSTSGNLLNLIVSEKVGLFNEELFIDSVDHDFCLRARIKGYKILQTKNIYLEHKIGADYIGSILNYKKKTFYIHSPKRMYFIVRNALYIRRKYGLYYPEYTRAYVKRIFERASKCIRYTNRRSEYLKYIAKGVYDYVRGRYGNRVGL